MFIPRRIINVWSIDQKISPDHVADIVKRHDRVNWKRTVIITLIYLIMTIALFQTQFEFTPVSCAALIVCMTVVALVVFKITKSALLDSEWEIAKLLIKQYKGMLKDFGIKKVYDISSPDTAMQKAVSELMKTPESPLVDRNMKIAKEVILSRPQVYEIAISRAAVKGWVKMRTLASRISRIEEIMEATSGKHIDVSKDYAKTQKLREELNTTMSFMRAFKMNMGLDKHVLFSNYGPIVVGSVRGPLW